MSLPVIRSIAFFTNRLKTVGIKDPEIGDFITLVVDKNSKCIADIFIESSKKINLKVIIISPGMNYKELYDKMHDLLRSDHSPFWKENIPGIFVTDTVNFRFPYYHTGADRIEFIDFVFLRKVAQASLLTMIKISEL